MLCCVLFGCRVCDGLLLPNDSPPLDGCRYFVAAGCIFWGFGPLLLMIHEDEADARAFYDRRGCTKVLFRDAGATATRPELPSPSYSRSARSRPSKWRVPVAMRVN